MITQQLVTETGWNVDNSYTLLPETLFSRQNPTPVSSPEMVILNHSLAKSLGLDIQGLKNKEGIEVFSGNRILDGSLPIAQAYAGHQFGHFTMLGDGRAVLLGELITPEGNRIDIQLKGSGRTVYSRGGDGRAALGPMLREYIISEAMYALGIPTTRSLAVVTTGEPVIRETVQPGAILTRIAASHLRVGTFQYASKWGTIEDLKTLADYTIRRHFPEVYDDENPYLGLLQEVIKGQAALIAKWQLVGFIHGVMNTDNMALSGETIDYGPCAFMDVFDQNTVFSSIDINGRYAYGNQPYIAIWNLARFAETLLPLLHNNQNKAVKIAEDAVSDFNELFSCNWLSGMRAKLGLFNEESQDESLINELLTIMQKYHADFTNTFRALTFDNLVKMKLFDTEEFIQWHKLWITRLETQKETKDLSQQLMERSNPAVIPRNQNVEDALESAVKHGDFGLINKLLEVLSKPYVRSTEFLDYYTQPVQTKRPYRTFCGT